ncbi:MAG: DJ-1/PfpI family protein [Alphaproteobacteria bacterium]|nr:DJ-1/PfpI family protein [Alphaproteobacteria bacterium]
MARVVIALATRDFDPTEAAVPWDVLTNAGHTVVFATADGTPAACDPLMLSGVFFGQIRATPENVARYRRMVASPEYMDPLWFEDIRPDGPDAHDLLILPGGHAPGMRQYLEDPVLQGKVAAFLANDRPLGSICHGAVVLARAKRDDGTPAVSGRRITGLPRTMELGAWLLTAPTMGRYFRTYPECVQDEALRALGPAGTFEPGPLVPTYGNPFVVRDGNLVSARWPGDAERFANALLDLLEAQSTT